MSEQDKGQEFYADSAYTGEVQEQIIAKQGLHLHSIGLARAKGIIGLINVTYNLCCFEQLMRIKAI